MIRIVKLLILVLFFSGCENNQEEDIKNVVLYISNPLELNTNFGTGIDVRKLERLNVNTNKKIDTVNVVLNRYRKIYIRNQNVFKYLIIEAGDTIDISILSNNIIFKARNKTFKKYDTTPIIKSNSLTEKLSKLKSLESNIYIKDEWDGQKNLNVNFLNSNKEIIKSYTNLLSEITLNSNKKLELLNKQDSISESYFYYNKSQNEFKEYSKLIEIHSEYDNEHIKEKISKYVHSKMISEDDFLAFGYLNKYLNKIIVKKNKIDYTMAFDTLSVFMSGANLKYTQLLCLENIAQNNTYEVYSEYENKYLSIYSDQKTRDVIYSLKNRLKIEEKTLNAEDFNSVVLQKVNKEELNLGELIKQNPNHILFVDFWASWCAPCREAFPELEKIKLDYKDKKIVFINISIDSEWDKWQEASYEENLNKSPFNFFAMNYPNSSFYKKLNLKSIPRYLLFDKNGILVHKKAPGPNDLQLRELIDTYIVN